MDKPMTRTKTISRGKRIVSKSMLRWREEKDVIYFSVTSDGTTGVEWISRLERRGFNVSFSARAVLDSDDFKPTKGVTYEIAVLKGLSFAEVDRTNKNIGIQARARRLRKPNVEVACLIRENFSDKEIKAMGLFVILTMARPIRDSEGDLCLLGAGLTAGGRCLSAFGGERHYQHVRDNGFAFVVSKKTKK